MNILKWPIRNGRGSFHALIVNTDGGIGEVRGIVSLKKKKRNSSCHSLRMGLAHETNLKTPNLNMQNAF